MNLMILGPPKALMFRIVHRANLDWITRNGLRSQNNKVLDPGFVGIGDPDLIDRRRARTIDVSPGGTLADYVPFYFTPRSPMLNKILTGHGGVRRREAHEIVVLISSLPRLVELDLPYLFTDRHAYSPEAGFFSALADLHQVDWDLLARSDYKRDPDDPGKLVRYQAEVLVKGELPWTAVIGVGCCDAASCENVQQDVMGSIAANRVVPRPEWFPR